MYGRALITGGVVAAVWAVSQVSKRRQVALAKRASQSVRGRAKTARIVYFWSDGCSVCKRVQRPILERILAEHPDGRLELTAHCVDEVPDVAEAWGVRTLPTTIVIDPEGNVSHVNNGLVVAERLREQLEPFRSR